MIYVRCSVVRVEFLSVESKVVDVHEPSVHHRAHQTVDNIRSYVGLVICPSIHCNTVTTPALSYYLFI